MSGRLLLRVSVTLGDGSAPRVIRVHERDVPEVLAKRFCVENGLPGEGSQVQLVSESIREQWLLTKSVPPPPPPPPSSSPLASVDASKGVGAKKASASDGKSAGQLGKQAYYEMLYRRSVKKNEVEKSNRGAMGSEKASDKPPSKDAPKPKTKKVLSKEEYSKVCARLYERGNASRRKTESKVQEIRQEREKEESQECTFQPKISDFAEKVRGGRVRGAGLEQQIRQYRESRAVRDQLAKEIEQRKIASECSFRPKIGEESEKLARQRRPAAPDLHGNLYYEAIRRLEVKKRQEEQPLYSFQPNTVVGSRPRAPSQRESNQEFLNRLSAPKQIDESLVQAYERYDVDTGQPLFHPQVGRAPCQEKARPPDLSISDYLFISRNQFKDIRNRLARDEAEKMDQIRKRGAMSESSKRIANDIMRNKYAVVWKSLRHQDMSGPDMEHTKLRCIVELLPQLVTSHLGREVILAVAEERNESDFIEFMVQQCAGLPLCCDLLLT